MILFSIIIPTYNSQATLAVALNSIAHQDFKNVEVLIMDGASTDGTVKVAEQFKEQIPGLVIVSEKDTGIYDAMNKGIGRATGKWLYFMGSDDSLYNSNVLENVYTASINTTAAVLYGNVHIIGNTGWAKDGEIYAGKFDVHMLLNQNICHQAIFYNREFLQSGIGHFNLKYKKSSDWDFNLRCWAKTPFKYLDITVANFSAGGLSTTTNDEALVANFVDNLRSYFNIGLFHPLINRPTFGYYGILKKKQQDEYPIQYRFENLKKRFINKFKKILP